MTAALTLVLVGFAGLGWAETWMGLEIAPEDRCSPFDREKDYSYSQSLEPKILERMGGEIRCRYTGQVYDSLKETDIEHVVAVSEAHDSGLCAADAETKSTFSSDLDNLTLADPHVNRYEKAGKDAAEWLPELNLLWYVETIIKVKRKYSLTVDRAEMEALKGVLEVVKTAIRANSLGAVKKEFVGDGG